MECALERRGEVAVAGMIVGRATGPNTGRTRSGDAATRNRGCFRGWKDAFSQGTGGDGGEVNGRGRGIPRMNIQSLLVLIWVGPGWYDRCNMVDR